ncbi:GPI-anchored cell wall organization protein ecm33 [Xylaria cf. heliscus]|nr:GPI-anchored cell wall organization protein ecm33 [Xylaria cf. heliscus]
MYSKELVSAVAALGLVSGAAALGCKDDPVEINSQADATQAANCDSIPNDVVFGVTAGTDINLSGRLTAIKGGLIVKNNGAIQSLSSSSLETIGGAFQLQNVTALVSLVFPALSEVGSIEWTTLNALDEPTFGNPGITKAQSVTVQDTFVTNLDGINVQALTDMNINNNHRLSKFSTSIKTLSNALYVNSNALNMTMEMPNLEWIANMTIANVSTFSVPSLKTVNGSMRFDSNYFTNFFAPNLTETHDGDLSFVSNPQLQNISIPLLKKVGGGLTIANNTDLSKIDGLNSLTDVGGAIKMRGSFDEIDLPKLNNVVGTAEFVSTEDITDSCDTLEKLSGNVIQGKVTDCHGSDATANNDTSSAGGSSGSSGSGSSGSGSSGDDSAASLASASMSTVVTLAALGGLVAAFL